MTRVLNTDNLSELAEDHLMQFPAIMSQDTVHMLGIVMPLLGRFGGESPEHGYAVYRYSATIRELTRD